MNSYFNQADFNPGGKYGPDEEAMQDLIDQASPFNVANLPYTQDNSNNNGGINWKKAIEAVDKSMARKKYQEEGKEQTVRFGKPTGSSGFQFGQDSYVYTPQQQAPFTVAGQQSSGGGLGSTIGAAAGLAAGIFIPGAQPFTKELMALGSGIGGQIG